MGLFSIVPAAAVFILFFAATANAQLLSPSSLTGKYFARHIQFSTDASNAISDARSILGTLTFDGAGKYSFTGQQVILANPAASYSVSGTYNIDSGGIVTLTNPQTSGATINARFSSEGVTGSATETSSDTFDFFIAIPAPTGGDSNATASGNWSASDFELTAASAGQVRSTFVAMSLDGAGNISAASLNGHAANANNGSPLNQSVTGGTYSVGADGSGTITFPLAAGLTAGNALLSPDARTLYISASGNVIVGATAGAHDLFVAVRNLPAPATSASGQRFWGAGIRFDSAGSAASYAGSATAIASHSSIIQTERLHETGAVVNVTQSATYTLAADGSGSIGAAKAAIEPPGSANANMVTASNGNQLDPTGYEVSVSLPIPVVNASGVFVNPQGIVNAASNAPAGDAISPGEFIAIYGSGLASATVVAQTLPFPPSLGGVSVSINGIAAPIYFVSSGQIDCTVPYGVTGSIATIAVTNGTASNSVTTLLATTSPGIFTVDASGTGDGSITHANGSLVNAASPAKKGETVVAYASGLGLLTTKVNDGFGATGVNDTAAPLTVYIAGVPVTPVYKGLTVDAGLYQVNFTIPSTLPVSGELPLAILTPDGFTDEVNIAVQ